MTVPKSKLPSLVRLSAMLRRALWLSPGMFCQEFEDDQSHFFERRANGPGEWEYFDSFRFRVRPAKCFRTSLRVELTASRERRAGATPGSEALVGVDVRFEASPEFRRIEGDDARLISAALRWGVWSGRPPAKTPPPGEDVFISPMTPRVEISGGPRGISTLDRATADGYGNLPIAPGPEQTHQIAALVEKWVADWKAFEDSLRAAGIVDARETREDLFITTLVSQDRGSHGYDDGLVASVPAEFRWPPAALFIYREAWNVAARNQPDKEYGYPAPEDLGLPDVTLTKLAEQHGDYGQRAMEAARAAGLVARQRFFEQHEVWPEQAQNPRLFPPKFDAEGEPPTDLRE